MNKIQTLCVNSHDLQIYHNDKVKKPKIKSRDQLKEYVNDDDSIGSISEADDLDIGILFNGDHSHQFEAVKHLSD